MVYFGGIVPWGKALSEVAPRPSLTLILFWGVCLTAVHCYKVFSNKPTSHAAARFIMKKVFAAFLSLWLAFLQKSSAKYGGCGEIVHITLVISEQVISPTCSPRKSLVVNGTLPGPALHINAGEHVHVR
jgi:hypothetical protein